MACLSLIPGVGWLVFILGGLLYLVDVVVQAYINNQRDLGAVLNVLNCNYLQGDFMNKPGYAFDSFKNELGSHRQGIIAYWHQLTNNNFPAVTGNAHFIYVRNDVSKNSDGSTSGGYAIYNRGDTDDKGNRISETLPFGNEVNIIRSNDESEANKKTIGYYVIE